MWLQLLVDRRAQRDGATRTRDRVLTSGFTGESSLKAVDEWPFRRDPVRVDTRVQVQSFLADKVGLSDRVDFSPSRTAAAARQGRLYSRNDVVKAPPIFG